jgi:phosphoglucomutase
MTYRMFGGNSENQAASELLQTIYKRTEETVKDKDARIAQLEKELAGLKTDALPYAQIARELAVDYPALRKLTLSKGMQVDVLSGNPVQYVTAVVQWAGSAADAADLERLEKRLKVRLNEQHLLVMPVYE